MKGDDLCLSEADNLGRLLDAACERYREQLSWRAEFDSEWKVVDTIQSVQSSCHSRCGLQAVRRMRQAQMRVS